MNKQPATQLKQPESESELVTRALAGDGRAFRALVQPHLSMLYRVAYRYTYNKQLAEDAVQEALLALYRALGRYQPGTNLPAYMVAIAVPKARTLARSERRVKAREEAVASGGPTPGAAQEAEARALAARIASALDRMPAKRQQAVVMRLDAGLSHAQIASALHSTEGSVRVMVHQGMKELKELVGG